MVSIYSFNHARRLVPRVLREQRVRVDLRLRNRHQNPKCRSCRLVEPRPLGELFVSNQSLPTLCFGSQLEQPLVQNKLAELSLADARADRLVRLEYTSANLIYKRHRRSRLTQYVHGFGLYQDDLRSEERRVGKEGRSRGALVH